MNTKLWNQRFEDEQQPVEAHLPIRQANIFETLQNPICRLVIHPQFL
jgi:hypothetical protein